MLTHCWMFCCDQTESRTELRLLLRLLVPPPAAHVPAVVRFCCSQEGWTRSVCISIQAEEVSGATPSQQSHDIQSGSSSCQSLCGGGGPLRRWSLVRSWAALTFNPDGPVSVPSSRLASSLTDLYSANLEDKPFPHPLPLPPQPSPSPPLPVTLSPCRYGNGARSVQHEVSSNSHMYGGSAAPPAGGSSSSVQSSKQEPQDLSYRGQRPPCSQKGSPGLYLSRSIPVSPQPLPSLLTSPLRSSCSQLEPLA